MIVTSSNIQDIWAVVREQHLFPIPVSFATGRRNRWDLIFCLAENGYREALDYENDHWVLDTTGDYLMFGGIVYCRNDEIAVFARLSIS